MNWISQKQEKKKRESLGISKNNLRKKNQDFFEIILCTNQKFYIQGSVQAMSIRTKDDTADLDGGVYWGENRKKEISATTIQGWVKDTVEGTTDATVEHEDINSKSRL
jgi:hypothetical protein